MSGDVMHIQGEGGAVFAMTPPLPKTIAQRLEKGQIRRVNADGSPVRGSDDRPTADEGGVADDDSPSRPAQSASKGEWVGYVSSVLGVDADEAESYTKQDLIDLAGQR